MGIFNHLVGQNVAQPEVANDEKQSLLVLKGIVTNPQLMLILIKYLLSMQVLDEKAPDGPFITFPNKLYQELIAYSRTHQCHDYHQRAQ